MSRSIKESVSRAAGVAAVIVGTTIPLASCRDEAVMPAQHTSSPTEQSPGFGPEPLSTPTLHPKAESVANILETVKSKLRSEKPGFLPEGAPHELNIIERTNSGLTVVENYLDRSLRTDKLVEIENFIDSLTNGQIVNSGELGLQFVLSRPVYNQRVIFAGVSEPVGFGTLTDTANGFHLGSLRLSSDVLTVPEEEMKSSFLYSYILQSCLLALSVQEQDGKLPAEQAQFYVCEGITEAVKAKNLGLSYEDYLAKKPESAFIEGANGPIPIFQVPRTIYEKIPNGLVDIFEPISPTTPSKSDQRA